MLAPVEQPDTVLIYEVYASEADFQAHWNGASMQIAREAMKDTLVALTGVRCRNAAQASDAA